MALSSKTTNNLGADKEAQRNALDQKTIEREARLLVSARPLVFLPLHFCQYGWFCRDCT